MEVGCSPPEWLHRVQHDGWDALSLPLPPDASLPASVQNQLREILADSTAAAALVLRIPATTFSSWMSCKGGTRTNGQPMGGAGRPCTPAERTENATALWMAQVYNEALETGGIFPIALHPAPDLRYVKAWHLPSWRRLLARRDLELLTFDWCAWRDHSEACPRQRMACLVPRTAGLADALCRTCCCPARDGPTHSALSLIHI